MSRREEMKEKLDELIEKREILEVRLNELQSAVPEALMAKVKKPRPKKAPEVVQTPECLIYLLLKEHLTKDEFDTLSLKINQSKRNMFLSNNPIKGAYQFSEFIRRVHRPFGYNSMRGAKVLTLYADAPITFLLLKTSKKVVAALKVERADFLTEHQKALMFDIDQNRLTRREVPWRLRDTDEGRIAYQKAVDSVLSRSALLRDSIEWILEPPLQEIEMD